MIIADTSVWIEFLRKNPKYFYHFLELVEQQKIRALECIFGELLQGVKNEREAMVIQEYWHHLPKLEESGLWISAGYLSFKEKLYSKGVGIVDATILIAGQKAKHKVWTLDKKLARHVSVSYRYDPAL